MAFFGLFHWKTYCKRCFGTMMTNYFCCKTISCIIYELVCFCTTFGEYFEPERYFFTEKCQQLGFFHNVSHQDWVTLDQSRQFIESQPFQCLNMNMMNGCARLRFEFILYNHHHTTAFESRVVTIYAPYAPEFHAKSEYVWTDPGISQHLNPSNLPLLV